MGPILSSYHRIFPVFLNKIILNYFEKSDLFQKYFYKKMYSVVRKTRKVRAPN